jgi:GxxExxY protein
MLPTAYAALLCSILCTDYSAVMKPNELTHEIIGAAIEVHRELGPGKPEAAYESALARELVLRGIPHQVQRPVPVVYKGVKLECGYRLDVLVSDTVVVEVKAVELVIPVHRAQTITYIKLGGWKIALLLNFNVAMLKEGLERFVLGFEEEGLNPEVVQEKPEDVPGRSLSRPVLRQVCASGDPEAERLATEVIAGAIEVHCQLGPGLLRSAYEECLCHELHLRGIAFERRSPLALQYKGTTLPATDEVGLLVDGRLVVSAHAMPEFQPVHEAQLLSQLRLGGWHLGLLINFNTVRVVKELRRVILSRGN